MPTISPILELQRQQLLLQMEYEEEKQAFAQKVDAIGMERRIKRGDAWWPVRIGRTYYTSLNQLCVEVFRTQTDDEIDHNFEFGRPVEFFVTKNSGASIQTENLELRIERYGYHLPSESPNSKTNHTSQFSALSSQSEKTSLTSHSKGTVSFVDNDRMVVTVPDGISVGSLPQEGLGIQLSFDETSYRMMFDALDRTMRAKGRLGYLRDLFYTPTPRKDKGGMRAETFSFADLHFPYLNPTQEHAVNEVLRAKDVAIVHGPPGTGKTTTLVEAIFETLHREPQVLVCAQSNMAVDWIVDRGVNVLRIGNPTRVNDKMLSFTYERRFEAHPDYELLWSIRKAIRDLRQHRKRGSENWHQKMDRLKSRAAELEIRINAELFGEARVIACTLVGSANRLLEGQKYHTLFIDEAAQALEAACWIPIRRVSRVVFAGDHCQLPPTVKSLAALKAGLGRTLMERLVDNHPEAVTLLGVQYRMNEEIMRFSSDWFYGGKVKSAPQVRHRGILDYDVPMEWKSLTPNTSTNGDEADAPSGYEEFIGESFGRINRLEAAQTIEVLKEYFTKIGKTRILEERIDVGVISPYRAQVQYLRGLIKRDQFFKPYRSLISVNTVDGFQGQERDVIIISLVRSNDEGQIGFLRDLRRMNVAITRARMKLIILGNQQTMTRHPFYRKLYEYIEALQEAANP